MKKRRSTVLVQPGKDVTLYVPSDTPPEVCEYLNNLKAEGMFSQGVMDIIVRYVQQQNSNMISAVSPGTNEMTGDSAPTPALSEVESGYETLVQQDPFPDDPEFASSNESELQEEPQEPEPEPRPEGRLNLAQIFQQAQKNAGRLTNSGTDN